VEKDLLEDFERLEVFATMGIDLHVEVASSAAVVSV